MASNYFPSALSSIVQHTNRLSTASAFFPGSLSSIVNKTNNISTAGIYFPFQLSSIVARISSISTAGIYFPSALSSIVAQTSNLSTSSSFFTTLSSIQAGNNMPPLPYPPPTFDTLTTTSARFSWGSHPFAAHYQLRIKQVGGTVHAVKDNLKPGNVSLSTISFNHAVPYAAGNWICGVSGHNSNGHGDVLWNSNNTAVMSSPFPGETITLASGTNFMSRTTSRDPDGFYYSFSVKLDTRNAGDNAGYLLTDYSTIPQYVLPRFATYWASFSNPYTGNDFYSAGDTDSQGEPLYYAFMGPGGTQKIWLAYCFNNGQATSNWSNGTSTPYPSLATQLYRFQTWRGDSVDYKEIREGDSKQGDGKEDDGKEGDGKEGDGKEDEECEVFP